MRAPETAVRSGPKAKRGLMPSPSTIAARSASSMPAAFHDVAEHLQGRVEHGRSVVLELRAGVLVDGELVVADEERAHERGRLGQVGHPRLDELGDRLETGQLTERLRLVEDPVGDEVGQQTARELAHVE